ncbi:MAG TPA: sigma-70 family RNA polymerase sigma factor [Planctomycetota bacterium]|jgi:RNA polymerase sigma-70 factor (ECF subfamily)|nr:sigma-70 family RNA polymerase sigma factor [Planctomycetota bacterium]
MDADALLERLITRAQSGSRSAFEELVRHSEARVRGWVVMHTSPGADADEISQRTYIQAFTRLADYQPGTSPIAWLLTLARYEAMTESTRRRRVADYHSRFALDLIEREVRRRAEQPVEQSCERIDRLRSCLERLGEAGRQFLRWRYEDDLPLADIAERSGRSLPSIKKQLFLLRRKLQHCIGLDSAGSTPSARTTP